MSRPLPRYLDTDPHQWERKLALILLGTGQPAPAQPASRIVGHRSAEGDPLRLRGIPCIARGISGMSTESAELLGKVHKRDLNIRRD